MARLFDKIPEDFFSPLSRKYKSIYSFALICLYHCLRLYRTDIKKTDYVSLLKSQGEEILSLFSIETDQLDDKDEEERVEPDKDIPVNDTDALLSSKVNYLVRKLARCGWFILSRNPKSGVEYIYLPAYSIQMIKVINDLTSDVGTYLPLVHQTYAELKMEDEKEDDYMYRSLLNARANADTIEMSVTLLKQQICVFGNKLTSVLDPNIALRQHFDEYRVDISERYYHPMKTFDSLGLYSQPTIAILSRWLKSERIVTLLVREAKTEPMNQGFDEAALARNVIRLMEDIIDILGRLAQAFNDIDAANANYTEAVQRKVNYLSSTDKTVKGKVDKIILTLAMEIKKNPALRYEEMPMLQKAQESVNLFRQGYLDSASCPLPFRRSITESGEPLPLEDAFLDDDQSALMASFLDNEVNRYSDSAITAFLEDNMRGKDEGLTNTFGLLDTDHIVLLILAILKADLGLIPYTAEKVNDRVCYSDYYMPLYCFRRVSKKA